MAPDTRGTARASIKDGKQALDHVLTKVLIAAKESPFRAALDKAGVEDILEFMELTADDLSALTWEHSENSYELTVSQRNKILAVQAWYGDQEDSSIGTWGELTSASFNEYRLKRFANKEDDTPTPPPAPAPAPAPSQPMPLSAEELALSQFKKGIKRNVSDYTELKDAKQWFTWKRNTVAVGTIHGCETVFDSTYKATTASARQLFVQVCGFMICVFATKIKESTSIPLVRKYTDDPSASHYNNAQLLFKDLVENHESGVTGSIRASELEKEIIGMQCDPSANRKMVGFLNAWQNKVMDLDNLLDSPKDDAWKSERLKTALRTHPLMNAQATALETQGRQIAIATSMAYTEPEFKVFFCQIMMYAKTLDAQTTENAKSQRRNHYTERGRNDGGRGRGDGGRGRGRGGRGGRGDGGRGRGDARGRGRGRGGNPSSAIITPTLGADGKYPYYEPHVFNSFTQEQRSMITRHNRNHSSSNGNNQQGSAPPSMISVNATQVEAQSVVPSGNASVVSTAASTNPAMTYRQMLSNHSATARGTTATTADSQDTVVIGGRQYRACTHNVLYSVKNYETSREQQGALIDSGANGGMFGDDVRILDETFDKADVTGISDTTLTDLKICTGAALIESTDGPLIAIMNQYASYGKGKTVHSVPQLASFGLDIDETSRRIGGKQRMVTPEGYIIPFSIRGGLAHMDMRPPTDKEMATYPHVLLTADMSWDPTILDNEYESTDYDKNDADEAGVYFDNRINNFGEVMDAEHHAAYVETCLTEVRRVQAMKMEAEIYGDMPALVSRKARPQKLVKPVAPDLNALRPHFAWMPVERIRKTLEQTTQFFRATINYPFRKHYKTRFPAANVNRLNEWFCTDTWFSDDEAHDDGIPGHGGTTMLQIFVGRESKFTRGYPMRSESEVSRAFENLIRDTGAPIGLFSDNAKAQIGESVSNLQRMYCIQDAQSEPHHQHQNFAERQIQDLKKVTNNIMDRTGTPAKFWLLAALYVIMLLNCMSCGDQGLPPTQAALGRVVDISAFLNYHWWQDVYYSVNDDSASFPSTTSEKLGKWVGVAEKQGDALTYLVLTEDTQKVIARSAIRPAGEPMFTNLRAIADSLRTDGGEETNTEPIVKSVLDSLEPSDHKLPTFLPEELLGTSVLLDEPTGETVRAKVTERIVKRDEENRQKIEFLLQVGDGPGRYNEIMSYNELSDLVERQQRAEEAGELSTFGYTSIEGHQGPLRQGHPHHKGSKWNVIVQWEDGTRTFEPLQVFAKDDPYMAAKYAHDNKLLDIDGWKFLKRIAKKEKLLNRMLRQCKMKSQRRGIRYKFGVRVPNNRSEAEALDAENGNKLWGDAIKAEIDQLHEYKTFRNLGRGAKAPQGYKRINVHLVFDVKESLKRKARMVAAGNLTDPPKDSVYSGVVSLRSLRLVTFLAELNDLKLMAADIGNAYLEAYTKEKVYVVAGPEFGELQGCLLIIDKALYGLRSSGARFHEKLADTLYDLGFFPSKADPDVWIRDAGDVYEYVCVYVDDIIAAMKDPGLFMSQLKSDPWNYKLKGEEEPRYHLGGDYVRDPDGTLCYSAKTYIKRLVNNFEVMFGHEPRTYTSPLEHGDHPELDETEFCNDEQIRQFQSMIGALQWTISLCRLDIGVAVMTLSRYRALPRLGHLERVKRIVGYLRKYPDAAIRFRTGIPDHSAHQEKIGDYDWAYSVYYDAKEEIPQDLPVPKGKAVRTTTFEDANLQHDLTTGRSVTGVIHLANQTPIDWFSKRQNTVETATYGSEFTSARTATEQIVDLRYTLRSFGAPIDGPAWMFGDNQSVVTSSTLPHSVLKKRHNALSYHRVREAIAAGILHFIHIEGITNVADVLTKFLPYAKAWPLLQPLLFCKGETLTKDELEALKASK